MTESSIPSPERLLFQGVSVIDGTGAPRRTADVLIEDGVIRQIAQPGSLRGATVIKADGLALAPGFIDMHAHSDLHLLTEPGHYAKLSQGVTTELLGQDGLSYAPVDDASLAGIRQKITGWNGNPASFDFSWRSVGEYLDRLDEAQIATNAAYLVPQGSVRAMVLGFAEAKPNVEQLEQMCELVREGMRQGALGMSSGLTYTPGCMRVNRNWLRFAGLWRN